ncbi:DNA-binding protein [Kibdelosporangium aridum]|uniref:DNA-binding protein n=1 Tax=Kibdelosporangium aridum TaxID=2030 RepID=A0A428YQX3_KIBAR|nr:helix-turn-helix domain-containing protein [Kibdelosporangium aridum]RSM71486.1 DNA-binding protein [Kibdelosporangium aridum]
MTTLALDTVMPGQGDINTAHQALPHIKEYLVRHQSQKTVHLLVDDEEGAEPLEVPRAAVELLARILAHMAAGQGVSIVPAHAELTTQQAADLLNVSRPFLITLLEDGKIEYRTVGTHRRVKAASLLAYMRNDDRSRQAAADELSALNQEMGLS